MLNLAGDVLVGGAELSPELGSEACPNFRIWGLLEKVSG